MKIKPTTYAELLIESIDDNANPKDLAAKLWHLPQKNKQYKDLPRVLVELEKVYAKKNGFKIAYVESDGELPNSDLVQIQAKLEKILNSRTLIKPIVKKGVTGLIAKTEDQVIDLSAENKIGKLRKELNNG
jgi:F0F1-type ATP synthase delta subunit